MIERVAKSSFLCVLALVTLLLIIINIINVVNFDEHKTIVLEEISVDSENPLYVSYHYETHNVGRIKYMVSFVNDQEIVINDMWGSYYGSYIINNALHINNFEVFNMFNKIMGRQTSDRGTITLLIEPETNDIAIYSSSDNYKSISAVATRDGLSKEINFCDYEFSLDLSVNKYHNYNTFGEWNDRVLAKGINEENGSEIYIYLIYE